MAEQEAGPIQIQQYLGGIDYPCSKDDLVKHAEGQGAPEEVISTLRELPDREYNTPAEVTEAWSEINKE